MKPVAVFIVVAALAVSTVAVGAKTVTTPQGNANDKSVEGVAGPSAAAQASHNTPDQMSAADQTAASDMQTRGRPRTRTARLHKQAPVPSHD